MNTNFSIRNIIKYTFLFFSMAMILTACKKAEDVAEIPFIVLPNDLTTKVTASIVSGFVTNENDIAVKDASVLIGTTTVVTDKYGYFETRNVQVIQNAGLVSVTKIGYFKGIKTFIATANKGAFFRIKLIPKTSAGTVSGTTGGIITLASGLSINFPASAIMKADTKAAYTGAVTVAAFYINPTSTELPLIMPGDLRGLDSVGNMKLLTSFGMVAVELTGASGELLQIATGKKASLTMPIPASLSATAAASIPLWYFNETNGLWKQEGVASKIGNNYVGDVSHFSFWNCDVPNNFVQFNCTVVNTAGQPVQNAYVKISLVSNPLSAGFGITDSSGYVSGAVPNNAQLKLEVFGNINCGSAAFSQIFTTTNVNVNFGNVTINTVTSIATLVGSVKNCAGTPVANGYIMIQDGNIFNRYNLSSAGTFSFNKVICNFPNTVSLIGEDIISTQQSLPTPYTITSAGLNNVLPIYTCGVTTQQYLNYTVNGTSYTYSNLTDSLRLLILPVNLSNPTHWINADRIPYSASGSVFIRFNGIGIAQGSTQNLTSFQIPQITDSSGIITPISVNISEYGNNIGQFVTGNFSGVLSKITTPNITYSINCNFRLKRTN
jgi:hypothetical protein